MSKTEEFVILRAYQPFLIYFPVYHLKNSYDNDTYRRIRIIRCGFGIAFLLALATLLFLMSRFLAFYTHGDDLKNVVQPLSYVMVGLPVPFIYIALLSQRSKVIDTLHYLREVVNESKFIYVFNSSLKISR